MKNSLLQSCQQLADDIINERYCLQLDNIDQKIKLDLLTEILIAFVEDNNQGGISNGNT